MDVQVNKTELKEILPFRTQFLQENSFQIRYDACHIRGWSDSYLLTINGKKVGYGSIKGKEELKDRDAIFEFYVLPFYRKMASLLFSTLLKSSKAKYIECQSNDLLLTSMQYEFAKDINADVVLFEDCVTTRHKKYEVIFRLRKAGDNVFGKKASDAGAYILEKGGEIIADGGFLLHYNIPFADLYMEVKKEYQNQGYGSFILQELKRECYLANRIPAARCNMTNKASKATLIKAGMRVCGFMLTGKVKDLSAY